MINTTTNVFGRYLISYSRNRSADIDLLETALRDVGIPIWRDTQHLSHANTANEIDQVLSCATTAGALLYLTPEVASSTYVLDLEVPGIFKRASDRDFLIVPIASGGLSYEDAGAIVAGRTGPHRLEAWNMEHVPDSSLAPERAQHIATRVLAERFERISQRAGALRIEATTRSPLAFSADTALAIDHRMHFSDRLPSAAGGSAVYHALSRVRDAIHRSVHRTPIEISGQVALGYACALGTIFMATSGIPAAWVQRREGSAEQHWSLATHSERDVPYEIIVDKPGSKDVALLLSVNDDVGPAFGRCRGLQAFGAIASLGYKGSPYLSESEALAVARSAIQAVREARGKCAAGGTLHIYAAAPSGMLFLIGQLLNTFAKVQTYEFLNGDYRPSLLIKLDP